MSERAKILVINDDAGALDTIRSALEQAGYDVTTRGDAATGTLNLIAQVQPDIVLIDVHMPTISGAALAKLIERTPKLPRSTVVLYSDGDTKELEELVYETGALGGIVRTNAPGLVADVRRMLHRR